MTTAVSAQAGTGWRRWAALGATCLSLLIAAVLFLTDPPATGLAYSQVVVDRDDRLLRLYTTDAGYWRLPADSTRIDQDFLRYLIACEDQRFWFHPGVDPLALARAAWQLLRHGRVVSGGSTLTMQTVRLLEPRPRNVASKLIEMGRALQLEFHLDKRAILDLYLSLAPYGGNIQGVAAATRLYFGKDASRLTPSEAALLISLPQAPEHRRPDRHPEQARQGRFEILRRLAARLLLSDEAFALANSQPIPERRTPLPLLAPHLADRLRHDHPGIQRIGTTLSRDLQERFESQARSAQERLEPGQTLAMVAVANHSREILAHVGSGDYHKISQLDLTRVIRSPGSTLKPFIYGLGFELGLLHPRTLIRDSAYRVATYGPQNFDRTFQGWMSAREALQLSRNIPAIRVLERVGALRLVHRLDQVGIRLRFAGEPGLPLALGGAGCTLEDLVSLYAGLASEGRGALLQWELPHPQPRARSLLTPAAAGQVDEILRTMPQSAEAGKEPIRYKTGTSYGFRDAWALGYRQAHTIGIWAGRPDAGSVPDASGTTVTLPLLFQAFAALPSEENRDRTPLRPQEPVETVQGELPQALRWFDGPGASATDPGQPRIVFPVDGSTVVLTARSGLPPVLVLRADGGRPPLHWLVNGERVESGGTGHEIQYRPTGPGTMRITLLDQQGRADRVAVWLE